MGPLFLYQRGTGGTLGWIGLGIGPRSMRAAEREGESGREEQRRPFSVLCVCVCVCASFALLSLPWVALAVAAVVGVAGAMGVQVAANKSPSTMFAQQSRICGNRVGTSVHSLCRGVEKLGVAPLRHRTRLAKLSTSSAGRRVAVVAAQAVSSDEATAPVEQSKRSSNAAWVENRAFFPPTFGGLEIESRNQMCRCICTLWVGEGA